MLDLLPDPIWQGIGVLSTLLLAALALYARKRHNENTKRGALLEAIYDLAHGSPDKLVASGKAAERASIPHTIEDFNPAARDLRDSGLIEEPGTVGLDVFRITPAGIRAVERDRTASDP
jgi:hypothetical protein